MLMSSTEEGISDRIDCIKVINYGGALLTTSAVFRGDIQLTL